MSALQGKTQPARLAEVGDLSATWCRTTGGRLRRRSSSAYSNPFEDLKLIFICFEALLTDFTSIAG